MSINMKKIGIMTSGGDCPGMNAAIRSVTRTCLYKGLQPYAIESGFKGLIDGVIRPFTSREVANTIHRGGTILRSARSKEFLTEEGQLKAVANLKKHKIDGLVIIGGDGSLRGAHILHDTYGIPLVGIPGSIDNDIYGTDLSLGVDTALNTIVNYLDMINDTASSHDRTFIIEVMGRTCGYLAVMSTITAGAEAVLIPEVAYDLEVIIEKIRRRYEDGKSRSIVIVAEGVGRAYDFGKTFELIGGFETRITVLGHIQRGGKPTHFDRMLASRMGIRAVDHLVAGKSGIMLGLQENEIVAVPLREVLTNKKQLDPELLKIAEILS